MATNSEVTIEQTVEGGKFVGRDDRSITLTRTSDFLADYGDDSPRIRLSLSDPDVLLRGADIDELIENLKIVRATIR